MDPSLAKLLNSPDDTIVDFVPLYAINLNPIPCFYHSPFATTTTDCLRSVSTNLEIGDDKEEKLLSDISLADTYREQLLSFRSHILRISSKI